VRKLISFFMSKPGKPGLATEPASRRSM
jgi:hypothetical protein